MAVGGTTPAPVADPLANCGADLELARADLKVSARFDERYGWRVRAASGFGHEAHDKPRMLKE
jgi:hypothetical protein